MQRGHIPLALAAQGAEMDQGEDLCGLWIINAIALAAALDKQYSPCCPRMLCRFVG